MAADSITWCTNTLPPDSAAETLGELGGVTVGVIVGSGLSGLGVVMVREMYAQY